MADGGGQAVAVPLSADLVARAVIAAAISFGDHPLLWHQRPSFKPARRALSAAASGLNRGLGVDLVRAGGLLGVRPSTLWNARDRGQPQFLKAEAAVVEALGYATRSPAPPSAVGPIYRKAAEPIIEAVQPGGCAPPVLVERRAAAAPAEPAHEESPIATLVLAALKVGPMTSMSLASAIDRKELAVSSALTELARDGRVQSRPLESGPRRLEWSLVP